jgi:hypothetical protein
VDYAFPIRKGRPYDRLPAKLIFPITFIPNFYKEMRKWLIMLKSMISKYCIT